MLNRLTNATTCNIDVFIFLTVENSAETLFNQRYV